MPKIFKHRANEKNKKVLGEYASLLKDANGKKSLNQTNNFQTFDPRQLIDVNNQLTLLSL
jgi:hypothetical protein